MASVGVDPQFGFGGFTKKNPFEISNNSNPTTGQFSFGVPTLFSGQSSSNSSSSTTSAPLFGNTSQFPSRPTTNNSFTTTSPFRINPFSSGGQTTSSFGTGGNSFTTSHLGTSSSSTGQSSCSSSTTIRFGTAPFSFKPTTNSFTTPQPFGIGPFSTGQTSSSHTTSPFTAAPPKPFTQPNNSWIKSPFGQTCSSVTTSPCGTAPFSFPQPTNPLTTSPTRFPSTCFPFTSTPTTSPSNVSVSGPPFSGTSIQGTRQEAYKETAFDDPLVSAQDGKSYKILSISAMPCYINKSHEELRLEDGIASTTTATTANIQPIAPQPVITPFSKAITPIQPTSQPVIAPLPKFNFQFPTSQTISTPSPNDVLQDSTVVPGTSIPPEAVSQGQSGCVTENNNQQQQHEYPCPVPPIIKPFQYGISCLPVKYENPKPLVNVRHLSMGRRRVPIKKYKPNADEKRVPSFAELPAGIYKKGAGLIPRENPRSWLVVSSPSSFRMIP